MKPQSKRLIKEVFKSGIELYQNRNALKIVRKQILNSDERIPDLTKQQKSKIKDYWGRFAMDVPTEWHRLIYAKTGIEDPSYVPEPIFHQYIKPLMNNQKFAGVWSDKAYIDYFIRGVKTAHSIIRNVNGRFLDENFALISIEEAQHIIDQYTKLVIKPATYTDTGKGVKLLHKPFDMVLISKEYKKNYVIQIPLKQHKGMEKLNRSSVNTIRVNSVLFEKEAYIMSAFVKVGQMGEFADNSGQDRYFIGIREDGRFCDYAINHDLEIFHSIPSGYKFAGQMVPYFDKVCCIVKRAHECIPHFGFSFWDVCIDEENDPVIVEMNLRYPDTVIPQVALGKSFFGDCFERVLNYVNN